MSGDPFKDLLDEFETMMATADALRADTLRAMDEAAADGTLRLDLGNGNVIEPEKQATLWPVVIDNSTNPRTITVLDQPDTPEGGWATKTLNRAQRAARKVHPDAHYACIHGDTHAEAIRNAEAAF